MRLSVVVSQSPSKNPAKRKLSWLFERASHWILDRHGVHGHVGKILLQNEDEDDEEDFDEADQDEAAEVDDKTRVIDNRKIPNRKIYCLDLKTTNDASQFIEEVKRIHKELSVKVVGLGDVLNAKPLKPAAPKSTAPSGDTLTSLSPEAIDRFNQPTNDTALAANGSGVLDPSIVNRIESTGGRRWYPVIDYSRCTNCMECIDFCLFGVYGVDKVDV